MPGRFARLSQHQENPNVRKELERRSKSSEIDYSEVSKIVDAGKQKMPEMTTVTSKDGTVTVVKNGNNYDLSVDKYLGGYETYYKLATDETSIYEALASYSDLIPVNRADKGGWIPFMGEVEVAEDTLHCFNHSTDRNYEELPNLINNGNGVTRNWLYFTAPENGWYKFEIGLFITLSPRNPIGTTYCYPENYNAIHQFQLDRLYLEKAKLILCRYTQTEYDTLLYLNKLTNIVALVDKYENVILPTDSDDYKYLFRLANRYASLKRDVTLYLNKGEIIVPFFKINAQYLVYNVQSQVYNSTVFDSLCCYMCQELEYFYVQQLKYSTLMNDSKANASLIDIVNNTD